MVPLSEKFRRGGSLKFHEVSGVTLVACGSLLFDDFYDNLFFEDFFLAKFFDKFFVEFS